ncbi:MAG: bifunctional 3-deoxy-7-phosphoheptulonate synthase/chorismate mutase type II [Chitinophagales bacterium]|nr:bifunctional 3-deoxy-7-phosphoheptulonate synthase/chorismate mutase type II [Chitinophagales bacterium]
MSFFQQKGKPFLIAGPCSAESYEQVSGIASALQQLPVHLFRAGVWKPRTRPGSFEGMGEEALQWLRDVKVQYSLPVTIEVASPQHVELALKYGIDVLWIGARTTVNPFQVQRIADVLKGVDIPVMVKNPVNPDVDLWQGAIERVAAAGITDIAAIHRGFSSYNAASVYRNQPNWPIPIELKRRMPDMPIICDPSHITGNRKLVADIAQKAMNMGFEGLMIETHTDPDNALSDAAQQVTPATLADILDKLVVRDNTDAGQAEGVEMEYLRQVMDGVDAEIIDLIARRMELSEKIGHLKKEYNMTAYQPERWSDIVNTRGTRAEQLGLSKEFIVELYEKIHHHSISKQLEILQGLIKQVKS